MGIDLEIPALPEPMKHRTLSTPQTRLFKTGRRLVHQPSGKVYQMAEVLMAREMLGGILERIGRLRPVPG